ncbi:hypothetical protein FJZ53_01775 [Candidatus Woesearchaeota archaeon]|nr:hypothetical protein [Candidatus Woesearchaeota archaeon]
MRLKKFIGTVKENKLLSEAAQLIGVMIGLSIAFKIAFYKQDWLTAIMLVFKIFSVIVIPGLFLVAYLHKRLDFTTRIIIGSALMIGFVSITSYYLGIIGLHVKYHPFVIPSIALVLGLTLFLKNR